MEILLFNKMEFREGLNFTVRLGEKWAKRVSPGDTVLLASNDFRSCKPAIISAVYVCDLRHMPNEVIDNHHDPNVTSAVGLVIVLKECYSELEGRNIAGEIFTYLGFRLIEFG